LRVSGDFVFSVVAFRAKNGAKVEESENIAQILHSNN